MATLVPGFGAKAQEWFWRDRTAAFAKNLAEYIPAGSRVLDVGAGNCAVATRLQALGFDVTPVDVADHSIYKDVVPLISDGRTLPFADDSFDVALYATVLHHTADPEAMLREGRRVAGRIVIVEDVHRSAAQKWATYAMDSVMNLEFFGHPHANKTDAQWRAAFSRLGLRVAKSHEHPFWCFFRSATYLLERI
jgi:ubiquinone/menaquinone biosynthesis C-methylase UbiE